MPQTYTPIQSTTLTSSPTSVTFSSIPSTYTDLIIVFSGTGTNGDLYLQFNNDTGTNYSITNLYGSGSAAGSNRVSSSTTGYTLGGTRTSTQTTNIGHIMNYSNTTTYKTVLGRGGSADYELQARVSLWRSTAAIDTIVLKNTGGNIATGATITLYGIKAA